VRRLRKKFKKPKLVWDLTDIKEDRDLIREYGLRRKRELLVAREILRGFRQRARGLIAVENPEEKQKLLNKLEKIGMLTEGKERDNVLALTVKNILERRLQTIVFRKGMADSIKHARQLITHGHIVVSGRRTKFPSYLVPVEEEDKISWDSSPKVKRGLRLLSGAKTESKGAEDAAPLKEVEDARKSESTEGEKPRAEK